jgi:hypothetical protein
MCVLSAGQAWAAEEVYKTARFGKAYNDDNSSYTGSFEATNEGFVVTVEYFNNNRNAWTNTSGYGQIKCGRKSYESVGIISTKEAIDQAITKVVVTIDAITASSVNSIKLYTSSNGSSWTAAGSFTKATGAQAVTLATPAADLYYKIEFDCKSASSNGVITVSKVEYYYNTSGASAPTISSDNVEITYDATSGSIAYTLANEVSGGSLSASVPSSSWITLGNGTSSPISFTCEANSSAVARTETVTLTYTYNTNETVTKDVTVTQAGNPNGPGSENNPYTVAQARAAIDAGTGITGVYATGIVSEIVTAYSSQYHNISYNISTDGTTTADQLQAYRGKGVNGADFTSEDDIQVGDVVVIYGNLKKHNSTYEFDANNQLVSLVRSQEKQENGLSYSSESVTLTLGDAFIAPTLSNPNNLTVTYESSNTGLATVTPAGIVSLVDGATGTATITASFAGDDTYKAGSASYTITVNKATVVYDGNYFVKVNSTSDLEDGAYLIVYEDDKLAFDGSLETLDAVGNTISVTFDENGIEANQTNKASIFIWDSAKGTLQSASGYYIGKTATGNGLNTSKTEEYTNTISISEGVATITSSGGPILKYNNASNQTRFRYYGSGQKDISLYKLSTISVTVKADPGLSFSPSVVNINFGDQFTAPTLNAAAGFNGTVEYSSSDKSVALVMDTETGDLRIMGGGTTTITATFAGDDTYKAGSASYTLIVTDSRIATTITQDNITIDIADIATLTQLTPVVKDANNNVVSYTNSPTAEGLPEVYFETVSDDNGILGAFDSHGNIVLNSVVGTATIKAVYNHFQLNDNYRPSECTFTITIVDPNAPGAVNNPYTVADARAAIDAGSGTQGVYATGIVTAIPTEWSTQHSNITFNIVDQSGDSEFLQAYRCVSTSNADASTIAVGDIVVVYGNLTKYNSTYEFGQGCELVSLTHPTTPTEPSIDLGDNAIHAFATGTDGVIIVDYKNITTVVAEVQFFEADGTTPATYDWVTATINSINNVEYVINPNTGDARTAYFKVYALDDDANDVYSELITVTQDAYVAPAADYATLPFAFNAGKADIENTDGMTQDGLDSDYASSPKLKFNGTDDYVLLHFDERPGTLTFDIKGNTFSGGTFKVQTSEDGITYTDLETYTELGNTQSEEFTNLGENVRYIKWVYTNKSGGNVALGNIALAAYVAPQTYTLTWDADQHVSDIFIYDSEDQSTQLTNGDEVLSGHTIIVSVDFESDYELDELSINNGAVTATWNDTEACYTFTMPAAATTISITSKAKPVEGNWVKTDLADLTADDVFVIVSTKGSDSYAMSNDNGTSAPDAVAVTVVGNSLSGDIANNLMWTVSGNATDGYSFYPLGDTENWLYCNNSNNGVRVGTNDAKVFSLENGYLKHNGTSRYVGVYDNQDWRCYTNTTGNIAGQTFAFYKFDADYTRTATVGNYGTICLPRNGQVVGAELYSIAGKSEDSNSDITSISLAEVTGNLEAGKPYIFKATTSKILVAYTSNDVAASADSDNGLVGSFSRQLLDNASGNLYVIKNNQVCKVGTGVYVGENKAYIDASQIVNSGTNGVKIFAEGVIDAIDGINGEIRSGVIYNIAGQRLQRPVRGINIINGKKVLVK